MKKILIVNKELGLEENERIKTKKNKTIIKDFKYFNEQFIGNLKSQSVDFKFFIEEWEVCSKKDKRVQLICANDGGGLRPVHIVSDLNPKNGAKALFQSEKMIILKIQNGTFEVSKNVIDDSGNIITNVLQVGEFMDFSDIKDIIEENFRPMVESLMRNYEKFNNEGYMSPMWAVL